MKMSLLDQAKFELGLLEQQKEMIEELILEKKEFILFNTKNQILGYTLEEGKVEN
jgi:hypothetical protein